ncbi:calcium/sodium antiporter [Parabacteroides pacaensis]|uniref:calcium/sodium antiporter n=1 Tax=Parabacteroides pacaensis TaxID=2086575 RepID=UPI000D106C92|nr:calcium/sodium antiporter [Parabacteroides pacaensis]
MEYIQLLGGLILLIASANYLVKGGENLALRLGLSPLVVGMTVIAFGTSAPEFIVSLSAALKGNPQIALGNIIGSNIANIGLILGITALLLPLPVQKASVKNDGPLLLLATILFIVVARNGIIGRWEGIIGLGILIGYTAWMIHKSIKDNQDISQEATVTLKPVTAVLFIIISSIGLAYGADFLIKGASSVATRFGISQKVIGITIIAFGTSLPELAASVVAAIKKQTDISIGNIVGSNLFNILGVIGLSSAIHPIPVNFPLFKSDFIWMLLFSILLLLLIYPLRKNFKAFRQKGNKLSVIFNIEGGRLGRLSGLLLLGLYIFYIYLLL